MGENVLVIGVEIVIVLPVGMVILSFVTRIIAIVLLLSEVINITISTGMRHETIIPISHTSTLIMLVIITMVLKW